jgi:hypothetical protein
VRGTLDACIVVRSMMSSIIVLGCPGQAGSRSLNQAGTLLALLHTEQDHSMLILRSSNPNSSMSE